MIIVKNINKLFNTLFISNFLDENGTYTTHVDIPLSELWKAEEMICKSPDKELQFILLGTKGKIEQIILDETTVSVNGGNGIDSTNQTKNKVDELIGKTGLDFIGFAHSHLTHHKDEFSQHDLNYIDEFKKTGGDHVNVLFKLKEKLPGEEYGRVNVQAINNDKERVSINMTS
ncbi:MAG: hypothetical protein Q9M94_02005 [Candidatus Gracilibacteria bacterium]|nr:hypothetical protein [Candidatus Gracilibacteria bacterium]MDQ7023540.1 hypothetical protein [Candidatus Gracilibacteria bacterium]